MRLIIDANALSDVFDSQHPNHHNFKVVKQCVLECKKGVMCIGGTKLTLELRRQTKFLPILAELQRKGKLETLDKAKVDAKEIELKIMEPNADFDDPHLIACSIIGKIELICTNDRRADTYIKDSKFYANAGEVPKIYRYAKQSRLLHKCF